MPQPYNRHSIVRSFVHSLPHRLIYRLGSRAICCRIRLILHALVGVSCPHAFVRGIQAHAVAAPAAALYDLHVHRASRGAVAAAAAAAGGGGGVGIVVATRRQNWCCR